MADGDRRQHRFAYDSAQEGDGFKPSVPARKSRFLLWKANCGTNAGSQSEREMLFGYARVSTDDRNSPWLFQIVAPRRADPRRLGHGRRDPVK